MTDGGVLYLERGFSQETVRELIAKGHRVQDRTGGFGGYQAIVYEAKNGVYYGASESRKDGHAAVY